MGNGRSIKRGMAKEQVSPETPMAQGQEQAQGLNSYSKLAAGLEEKPPSPEKQKQINMVNSMLTDMVYHEDAKASVQSMLKQGPPEMTIPKVVNTLFMKFEDMTAEKKGPIPLDIKLVAGVHLFSEVLELAESMGIVREDLSPDQLQPMLKASIQEYIQRGLKEGSIDPIELQERVEPLLSDEEREIGLGFAKAMEKPEGMTQTIATEGMMQQRQRPLKMENQRLQEQNKGMQQALQGVAQAPQENGGM